MSTKLLMISSAFLMGLLGITASFIPEEILTFLGQSPTPVLSIMVQIMGALYIGFSFLNWMAKSVLIGGIYSRPLCIGNLTHFLVGGLALLKFIGRADSNNYYLITLMIVYLLFALTFGFILLRTANACMKA